MKYGDETIAFFEWDQPSCVKTYGQTTAAGTCNAVLGTTGVRKCYNTRSTCQSTADYAGTETKTVRCSFSSQGIQRLYNRCLPCLESFRVNPMAINLGGLDQNLSGLGQRESLEVRLKDFQHDDIGFDKYRLERHSGAAQADGIGYNPKDRGTFFPRWFTRNKYLYNYPARLRIGYFGQALDDMMVRHYIMTKFSGPNNGEVSISCKDYFSLVENRKSVAPFPSKGRLSASLTTGATSATMLPAGIGNLDYPASGYVRIGSEIMAFTRSGDVLTLTRAQYGTDADTHDSEDTIQLCLEYLTQRPEVITHNLLTVYSEVPSSMIDLAAWTVAASPILNLYSRLITEPTPVAELIGQLAQEAGFTVWPDVFTRTIQFKALAASTPLFTLTDNTWIVQRSLSHQRADSKRISQVWVYFGIIDPTKGLEEDSNFRSKAISIDSSAELPEKYGIPAVHKVYSGWISQFGRSVALGVGSRLLQMFVDPPIEARHKIPARRQNELGLAQLYSVRTASIQDADGSTSTITVSPVRISFDDKEAEVNLQGVALAEPSDPTAERFVFIDSDTLNVNLRTAYDSIYPAPTGVEVVTFEVASGITVGSSSPSLTSIDVGTWPAGVTLKLTIKGRVQGAGGLGGGGGNFNTNGSPGGTGGTAVTTTRAITIDNQNQLWGGGGGGGGGGGWDPSFGFNTHGGGGGGGGAGNIVGSGGAGGLFGSSGTNGSPGNTGTTEAGGSGGTSTAAGGGAGGGPGLAGGAGGNASPGDFAGSGGAGGAAGNYIVGNAFVTWMTTGDRRGGVA